MRFARSKIDLAMFFMAPIVARKAHADDTSGQLGYGIDSVEKGGQLRGTMFADSVAARSRAEES
jgi:hypothetical protein